MVTSNISGSHMATYFRLCLLLCFATSALSASQYYGQVTFKGSPVPGVSVTAAHSDQKLTTVTDTQGLFSFPDLIDGPWTVQVEMLGFATVQQEVVVAPNIPPANWELKLLPLDQIKAEIQSAIARAVPVPETTGE